MCRWIRRRALLPLLALLGACSAVDVLNSAIPDSGFHRTAGIAYGPDPRQRLDVYRPVPVREDAPVVVFFYGGRWQSGARGDYRFIGEALTAMGAVAVIPDYRLYPEVIFPAWMEDGAEAVNWARRNAARFGGDPNQILLVGHSAGAHTAVLLVLDERYLEAAGVPRSAILGAVGIAGPYDFLPFEDADLRALFGPPSGWPETQPIRFVDGDEPPLMLLQAGADRTVDPHNAPNLEARVRAAGGEVERIVYSRLGHLTIIGALAAPLRRLAPVWHDIARFLRAQTAVTASDSTIVDIGPTTP